ncbi:NAD(P)-binding Rossmann-fold superfamily protein [Artemisia annua]|uniref:NAD(P)-binding Rossmann-fold superfamily protein n=1 Tax=Artemisia annua TaxID=35608 RepID=A0A2U1MGI2_ARTAN|nr:NAD(P)-binding Rossmann-fold superfamily protein [Artemisia annua]
MYKYFDHFRLSLSPSRGKIHFGVKNSLIGIKRLVRFCREAFALRGLSTCVELIAVSAGLHYVAINHIAWCGAKAWIYIWKRKVGEYEIPLHLIGEPIERLLNATASFTKILAPPFSVDDVALAATNPVKDDDCFGVFTIGQIKEVAAKVKVWAYELYQSLRCISSNC